MLFHIQPFFESYGEPLVPTVACCYLLWDGHVHKISTRTRGSSHEPWPQSTCNELTSWLCTPRTSYPHHRTRHGLTCQDRLRCRRRAYGRLAAVWRDEGASQHPSRCWTSLPHSAFPPPTPPCTNSSSSSLTAHTIHPCVFYSPQLGDDTFGPS